MAHSMKSEAMALGARVATMGLGVAVAGHLGGAVVGWLGAGLLGAAGVAVVNEVSKKFGELAGEQAAKAAGEAMLAKFDKGQPGLEDALRDALRISLNEVPDELRSGYEGWFEGWEYALKREVHPDLSSIGTSALLQQSPEDGFCRLLEVLFAQSEALRDESQSVTVLEVESLLDPLRAELLRVLPVLLQENFREVKNSKEFDRAWKAANDIFQAELLRLALDTNQEVKIVKQDVRDVGNRVEHVAVSMYAANATVDKIWAHLQSERRISVEEFQAVVAERDRLVAVVKKFEDSQAESTEPTTVELDRLVSAGEIKKAIDLKSRQRVARREEIAKLPADCYQLGLLYEMNFDWPNALACHKEAWDLERNPEYGFQYAYVAQRQKHFDEAISVYEELRPGYVDPADVALTLNNLAVLYSETQRLTEAQAAYGEALETYRELAKSNPDAYLPNVATMLNNLANLYRATQRLTEAEEAYGEALETYRELAKSNPEAYLPDVAMTLNNLAVLYSDTQRLTKAEKAYGEALEIRRELAKLNPDAYLPDVAMTLNNLAVLYSATQRLTKAEKAYGEALEIRRELAKLNPDAYLPDVAMTLNNLAVLYSDTQRLTEAEGAYGEALETYRKLAKLNPDAYLPDVAMTLNNLAVLCSDTQRLTEAEGAYGEALETYRKLVKSNPDAYLSYVAMTLNNLAILYRATQRLTEAEGAYGEALETYRELADFNPDAYIPDLAMTLNNLANLYRATQRLTEAEEAYGEALAIRRTLAKSNPDAYLPRVATTLNNLANLYSDTQRLTEAEEAYGEALEIRRELAKSNPDAYLPDVAMTLNNLANLLLFSAGRLPDAELTCKEAAMILEPLWRRNPTLHGDQMGRIRLMQTWLMENRGELSEAICAEARRGLEAVYAPDVKAQLSAVTERHCGNGATV